MTFDLSPVIWTADAELDAEPLRDSAGEDPEEEPDSEELISDELDDISDEVIPDEVIPDELMSDELDEPISEVEPISEEEPVSEEAVSDEPVSEEELIAEVSDWAADPAEVSTEPAAEPADVAAVPPLLPQALSTRATAAVPARATARYRRKPLRSQRTVITILVVRAPAVCGPSVALPRQPDSHRWGRDVSP